MAPTPPRNAYNLFFSFYKNMHANPSLQIDFERSRENREQYTRFVLTVLNDHQDGSSLAEDGGLQKYMGNKDFTGMSKKVGNEWKKVDALTRSIFKELAKEESKRYKRELYESYRSFSRNQWQSKSVPTQEAMSALGRNQKLSQREDDRTEVSGNPGSKEAGSNRNEIVDVYNSWCTAGMNEVQFDMPEGQVKAHSPSPTMLHAASMPELNSNRANDFFQDEFNQGAYAHFYRSNSVTQASRFVRKSTSLNGIPEVDLSNEAIFAMCVSSWGLNPSVNRLPLEQDNGHISGEDLSELLSAITQEQIFP